MPPAPRAAMQSIVFLRQLTLIGIFFAQLGNHRDNGGGKRLADRYDSVYPKRTESWQACPVLFCKRLHVRICNFRGRLLLQLFARNHDLISQIIIYRIAHCFPAGKP